MRALIGPNGAGKSTFFKMLAGVMPPSSGTIQFQGRGIASAGVTRVCQMGMSTSFQINQLFERLTVRENLMIPCLAKACGRFKLDLIRHAERVPGLDERINETLALVGLSHRADTPVSNLAYGEKRRVEIGLALATQPTLLLLDEPLAGMGLEERANTVALIKSLRKGRVQNLIAVCEHIAAEGQTIVVVEQNVYAALKFSHRAYILNNGHVMFAGTPADLKEQPDVLHKYLGV